MREAQTRGRAEYTDQMDTIDNATYPRIGRVGILDGVSAAKGLAPHGDCVQLLARCL